MLVSETSFVSLDDIRSAVEGCRRCVLAATRTTPVVGVGDARARVMLVGEAPGRNEDLKGEPFVGAAGRLLDELLATAGLVRSEVYIANVLKCRPPGNRNPRREEIQSCLPFLQAQVRVVSPQVVVTLGNYATRSMLDTDEPISRLHGKVRHLGSTAILPVYHPAAAIYDKAKRAVLIADFQVLGDLLAQELAT